MARLKLKGDVDLKAVGHAIFEASALYLNSKVRSAQAEAAIDKMFDFEGVNVNVCYHYDEVTRDDQGQIVSRTLNIVIPDLSGKVRDPEKETSEFELSDFAAEAMGSIVMLGCGE